MDDNVLTGLDAVLTGIEAALELERELGVRTVECERSLLAPLPPPRTETPASPSSPADARARAVATPEATVSRAADRSVYDFVFLHDRKLSEKGAEMMSRIVDGLKRTPETAPIVVEAPLPAAKVYVVLGSFALKKFFPQLRGAPGQWLRSEAGADVLVSNSPEYILRFGVETPAVKKIKQDMWRSLKTVPQRLAAR
ncbi:MAG: hypothetical protein IKC80_09375 [Kiritimatiellae bacterium]|nr:hypothetical protein [Kiritimatiellia bacterium]